jgi:hypothetical protein
MAIATAQQRENLAIAYGAAATHTGLQTTTAAGTQGTEVTGAGYARQALTWAAGTVDGVVTASATFTVPASVTVQSAFLTTSITVGSGTFLDSVAVSYAAQGSPGTLTVNFTFTES